MILLIGLLIYKITTFELFEVKARRLEEIQIPNQNYILRIYHIPSNATLLDYIQVRKFQNNSEDILGSFERYDSLVTYSLSDSTLELMMINTVQMKPRIDTLILKLK
ncbi:hypothetical protein GCM10009120_26540 [Sphingobacterium siyangense subsp. cladoniae]